MLSQAVLAAYTKPESDNIHVGQLTVTGISPCPYATYLNYHKLDVEVRDAASILRMKNGKWQELECLEDLRKAGFKMRYTGDNQVTVHVGKSRIAGRPDGLIWVDNREDVLSIKARSLDSFTGVRQKGISAEPLTECQEQMYLASEELQGRAGCWVYYKHKDSCRPYDLFLEKNPNYSKPILEAVDEIVLGQVEVRRPDSPIPLCAKCRHRQFCWKSEILNTGGIRALSEPDLVDLWLQASFHLDLGKQYNEEARIKIKELLGSDDVLLLEGSQASLEARRIIQHRSKISENKFVEKFGAAALLGVIEETEVEQMRIIPRF
jgi:CRISPR/Cas system-associated exonuclease Cas4 (RecB family)